MRVGIGGQRDGVLDFGDGVVVLQGGGVHGGDVQAWRKKLVGDRLDCIMGERIYIVRMEARLGRRPRLELLYNRYSI